MDVRTLRKAARMTQYELARRTGISRMKLSLIECGYHEPSTEEVVAIQRATVADARDRLEELNRVQGLQRRASTALAQGDLLPELSEWCLKTCRAYPAWLNDATEPDPGLLQTYVAVLQREAPAHGGLLKTAQWLLAVAEAYAAQHQGEDPQSLPFIGRWLNEALYRGVEMTVVANG